MLPLLLRTFQLGTVFDGPSSGLSMVTMVILFRLRSKGVAPFTDVAAKMHYHPQSLLAPLPFFRCSSSSCWTVFNCFDIIVLISEGHCHRYT